MHTLSQEAHLGTKIILTDTYQSKSAHDDLVSYTTIQIKSNYRCKSVKKSRKKKNKTLNYLIFFFKSCN